MVQNNLIFQDLVIHFPPSLGVSAQASKRMSAAERASEASRAEQAKKVSGVSERANRRVSGPLLPSGFLDVLDHSASWEPSYALFTFSVLEIKKRKKKSSELRRKNHSISVRSRQLLRIFSKTNRFWNLTVFFCLSVCLSVCMSVCLSLFFSLYVQSPPQVNTISS